MAEESKDLAVQLPDTAIVRRYGDWVAKSAKDIQRGEMVFVDRHGVVQARPRFRRLVLAWKVGILGAVLGGGVLAVCGFWLPGSLLYLLGLSPRFYSRYRGTGKLMAIEVIVRQGQLDEGQRRFDAVPELRHRNPILYCRLAGNLASHRGDHATAIGWWREAFATSRGMGRELLKLSIAVALLLSGRIEEARREREALTLPPEADRVVTGYTLMQVMFDLCDPSRELPADDELHDRARGALEYSHTGVELAAIGWVFERKGDEDMARWLATEALDRMHYPYLATWWPALQQWLDAHATKAT